MPMFNLGEMKRRLSEIDAEREQLLPLIAAAEAYEAAVGRVVHETGKMRIRTRPRQRVRIAPVMEATENTVISLVEETGKPVSTAEVAKKMQEEGLPVPERNPNNVISARLSNSTKIKGRRGYGWLPVSVPWPHEEAEMAFDTPPTENPEA